MPTFKHGKGAKIAVGGNTLTDYLNEASNTSSVEPADTTTFGNDAHTYIVGLKDGTVSLSGLFDGTSGAIDEAITDALGTDDSGHFMVLPSGDGDGPGSRAWFGKGEVTSYETSSPVADVVSVSIELQADGGAYSGVYLRAAEAGVEFEPINQGATENSGSVDNSASSADGGVGQVHVTDNTLSGTLDVKIQDSPDNSAWADLITFTQVGAATDTAEQASVTGTVDRYVRSQVVAAAGSGSANVAVAFKRN